MAANDTQVGGDHYSTKAIQPWDYILSNNLGFIEGNIIKYVTRYKDKNGVQDLKKAHHYLTKLIESLEGKVEMAMPLTYTGRPVDVDEGGVTYHIAYVYRGADGAASGEYEFVGYDILSGSRHYFNTEHIIKVY